MPYLIHNKAYKDKFLEQHNNTQKICFDVNSMLDYFIELKKPQSMLLIVPTGRIVQYYKNRFIWLYFEKYGEPCQLPQIFTLDKFVQFCYGKIFKKEKKQISDPFIYTLIEESINRSNLRYFTKSNSEEITDAEKIINYSFVTKIANIITGLKEDGITPEMLRKDAEAEFVPKYFTNDEGGVKDPVKLGDFAEIFKNYQILLEENNLLDNAQFYIEMLRSELLRSNDFLLDEYFDNDTVILLDQFTELKQPQLEFLLKFNQSKIPFAINIDFSPVNGPLFGNLKETIAKLQAGEFLTHVYIDKDEEMPIEDEIKLPPSQYLRRRLFNSGEFKSINYEKLNDTIKVLTCKNQVDEVITIAKLVYHLVKFENYEPTEIAIVCRKPELYSNLFRDIFARNKIECFVSDRFDLANSPIIVTIFNVFDLILKNFRIDNLKKTLQSNYIDIKSNSIAELQDFDYNNLLNVMNELPFKEGRGVEFLKNLLSSSIEFFQKNILSLADDEFETNQYITKIKKYKKALTDLETLSHLLRNIDKNKKYTPQEFSKIIKEDIVARFNIRERIYSLAKQLQNIEMIEQYSELYVQQISEQLKKDVTALMEFISLVDEFAQIHSLLYLEAKYKLQDYLYKLKIATINKKYQIRESADRGVKITSVEQIIGIPFKVVILCGAVDGDFPLSFRTDYTLGKILPKSETRHLEAEKILFYKTLTNNIELLDKGKHKIFITYPEFSEQEENIMSSFISALFTVTTLNSEQNNRFYKLADFQEKRKYDETVDNRIKLEIPFIDYITDETEIIEKVLSKEISIDRTYKVISETDIERTKHYINTIINEDAIFGDNLSEKFKIFLNELKNKVYSISEVETFAACPYKYFIKYILRIAEPEEKQTEISALDVGNLLHKIASEFMSSFKSDAEEYYDGLVKLNPSKRQFYIEKINSIAEKYLEFYKNFDYEYYVLKEKLFGNNDNGILAFWVERELAYQTSGIGFYPAYFEKSFGDNVNGLEICHGVKVRGKIDRIDINKQESKFIVIDYKKSSGSVPHTKNDILEGKSFQIPVYVEATKQILSGLRPAGGVYFLFEPIDKFEKVIDKSSVPAMLQINYKFNFETYQKGSFSSEDKTSNIDSNGEKNIKYDLELIFNQNLVQFKKLIEMIAEGKFAERTNDIKKCINCSYTTLCRQNNRQTFSDEEEAYEED